MFILSLAQLVGAVFLVYGSVDRGSSSIVGAVLNMFGTVAFFASAISMPFAVVPGGIQREDPVRVPASQHGLYNAHIHWDHSAI